MPHAAHATVGLHVGRVQLQRAPVAGQGVVGVLGGIPGVHGDGPPDALGGLTVISLLVCDDAKQVQGVGVVGFGAEDVAVPPGRLGQEAALLLLQAEAEVVAHGKVLRG